MPVVAISGGEIRTGETLPIDRFIVSLSGKAEPRVLFVPTASGDSPSYGESVHDVYATRLGCHVSTLKLIDKPDAASSREMTDEADIIYVGGGNTKLMLDTWRVTGFDAVLSRAWKDGKVLAGVSAGAMCWFTRGFSDYDSFGSNNEWQFKPIDCLDFTPGLFCPHLDSEHRMLPLIQHISDSAEEAYAGMDGTALVVDGEHRRAIRVHESANMYHLRPSREGVHVTEMPATTLG